MTDARVPLAGVIGSPVAHSKSPQLFRHWLSTYGIPGHYVPMDIARDDVAEVLTLLPKMGFKGVNVTIPHKEGVMSLADAISDRATLIGAANTLTFTQDNKIYADNTDGQGFLENLKAGAPDWDPTSGPATVLGAGGSSRSVVLALLDAGVPEILLSNRTRARAEKVQDDFGNRVTVVDWVQAGNVIEEARLLVNTTSLGMLGKSEMRVPLDGLVPGTVVTDLVYAPLKTRLLQVAEASGCLTVDGLGMLLHQAIPGFERWFGASPDVDTATRAAVLR